MIHMVYIGVIIKIVIIPHRPRMVHVLPGDVTVGEHLHNYYWHTQPRLGARRRLIV